VDKNCGESQHKQPGGLNAEGKIPAWCGFAATTRTGSGDLVPQKRSSSSRLEAVLYASGKIPRCGPGRAEEFVRDAEIRHGKVMPLPGMKILPFLFALAAVFTVVHPTSAQPALPAQAVAAQAEVAAVKFGAARFNGEIWFEAEVEVNVKPGGKAVSGQFVDRVRATLSLALEAVDDKGAKRMTFYRSSTEAISLEGGAKSVFRFYLPPEVVRRDKIRPDVKYYVVELEVGGQPQPPVRGSASSDFTSPDSTRNFLAKASSESGQNEGVLLPQHLSPFALDSQRRAPSVFRREGQR